MRKQRAGSDILFKEILSTREAAALLKVTTQTIKNYIHAGKLKALKTPGGHHRIRRSDIEELGFVLHDQQQKRPPSYDDLRNAYSRLLDTFMQTVEMLSRAFDKRDIISSGHSVRVAEHACAIGRALGYSENELYDLRMAALLHDVGKIGIGESVLGKPGKLTDQEFFLMKQHSEIGEKIVSGIEQLRSLAPVIRHHHERFDGAGYPDGLCGGAIEQNSRIIAVAGAFDFLCSDLSFRPALPSDAAIAELTRGAGTQFDPDIVDAFTKHLDATGVTVR